MKTLRDVQPGQQAVVKKIHGQRAVTQRIRDLGVVKGVTIDVLSVAPLGDPIKVMLRGYELTLRKDEAAFIEVA